MKGYGPVLRAGIIGDGLSDIERGRVAAHVVGAHLAFRDQPRQSAESHFSNRGGCLTHRPGVECGE